MNRNMIAVVLVVIFTVLCISTVSADNNTSYINETSSTEDLINYITAVSLSDNGIKFSDGFTGFCIDSSKKSISADDRFTQEPAADSENAVKLAVIECYKASRENEIGDIIEKVLSKDTSDEISEKVLSSSETVADTATADVSDDREATFEFELLKSADSEKSDCLAYKVSFKTVKHEDILSAADEESSDNQSDEGENITRTSSDNQSNEAENTSSSENITDSGNGDKDNTEKTDSNAGSEKTVTETNKTVIHKNNTVIINENNTTVINQNNTKIINKTNETPQNATVQDTIMKTAGNPVFILAVVIIIAGVAAVLMRRKD